MITSFSYFLFKKIKKEFFHQIFTFFQKKTPTLRIFNLSIINDTTDLEILAES